MEDPSWPMISLIVAPKSPPPSRFSKLKAMVVKFASILSDESCQTRNCLVTLTRRRIMKWRGRARLVTDAAKNSWSRNSRFWWRNWHITGRKDNWWESGKSQRKTCKYLPLGSMSRSPPPSMTRSNNSMVKGPSPKTGKTPSMIPSMLYPPEILRYGRMERRSMDSLGTSWTPEKKRKKKWRQSRDVRHGLIIAAIISNLSVCAPSVRRSGSGKRVR